MKNKGFITMMSWILLGFSLIGCSHQEEDKEIETIAQHFLREVIILDFHQKDEDLDQQVEAVLGPMMSEAGLKQLVQDQAYTLQGLTGLSWKEYITYTKKPLGIIWLGESVSYAIKITHPGYMWVRELILSFVPNPEADSPRWLIDAAYVRISYPDQEE